MQNKGAEVKHENCVYEIPNLPFVRANKEIVDCEGFIHEAVDLNLVVFFVTAELLDWFSKIRETINIRVVFH